MSKTCTGCKETKAAEEFGIRKASKDGRNPRCLVCARTRNKDHVAKWLKNNPEKRKAVQTDWNRRKGTGANRKWRFGLSEEAVQTLIELQGGVCGLCKRGFSGGETFVDHDHACCPTRGKKTCGTCVRSILCRACNQGLGLLQESPELLRAAADYIERHRRSS